MAQATTSRLAWLLGIAMAVCLTSEVASVTFQCRKDLNGLYPDLDNTNFTTFARCVNGKAVGATRTCPKGRKFSFGWQTCVPSKFVVAFDERKTAGAAAQSADGTVPAAVPALSCVESGPEDGEDPGVHYKTCGIVKMKSQCDRGQKWIAGAGCVDSLGDSNVGNAYEGYTRLPDLTFKNRLVDCSLVDTIIKAVQTAPATKFVVRLISSNRQSTDFAFEVLARNRGGVTKGLTKNASLSIAAETNIKSLEVEGETLPGIYYGYVMTPRTTLPNDGDILRVETCKFVVTEPVMVRRLKKLNITLPSDAPSPLTPAAVDPEACAGSGTLTVLSCGVSLACMWFTWGICGPAAVAVCGASSVALATCVDSKDNSCFPADALVQLRGGITKRMDQLALGDKLQTMSPAGATTYSDVYLFGHDDPHSYERFVALKLSTNKLVLTHGHFVPTASGPACSITNPAACTKLMKRAADVQLGDLVWAVNATNGQFGLDAVKEKGEEVHRGLYNPFTLSGDLVVNGVLASAHSDWFLDRVMPQSHVSHIPAIYQTVMAPMRAAYYVGGPNAVKYLAANLKVVELASKMSL